MKQEDTLKPTLSPSTDLLNPIEILDAMIELRVQLRAIEEQIENSAITTLHHGHAG